MKAKRRRRGASTRPAGSTGPRGWPKPAVWASAAVLAVGLALAAAWLLTGNRQAGAQLRPDDATLVARGAGLYAKHCASCHGANREGEANWRQRRADGTLPAPPHDGTGHTWHHPDKVLIGLTREGPAAYAQSSYQSNMPAFGGILSDEDIVAVLSYMKSRWPAQIRQRHDEINQRAAQQ